MNAGLGSRGFGCQRELCREEDTVFGRKVIGVKIVETVEGELDRAVNNAPGLNRPPGRPLGRELAKDVGQATGCPFTLDSSRHAALPETAPVPPPRPQR